MSYCESARFILIWDILQHHHIFPVVNRKIRAERSREFGALLKLIRDERCLSQEAIARQLGRPQSFVSKYEAGERRIDIFEFREILAVLGISVHSFLRRLDQTKEPT